MTRSLRTDRRGTTALELALVFPVFLLILFGILTTFDLIMSRRAMDYGLEKALRYAAVHSTAGAAAVKSTLCNSASVVMGAVGSGTCTTNVTLTPATPTVNSTLQISYSYTWTPTADYSPTSTPTFSAITMTATGSVYVVN
jgi:Flp pilus assembly protein TadG